MATHNAKTGIPLSCDTAGMKKLARDLRKAAPEVNKEFRVKWREAAKVVAEAAKSKASFSTKIPGSIKVRGSGVYIKVIAGGDSAPSAAAFENKGVSGSFKHPVFERTRSVTGKNGRTYGEQIRFTTRSNRRAIASGRESAAPWVTQTAHPFLAPALSENREKVIQMMGDAVEGAVNKAIGGLK